MSMREYEIERVNSIEEDYSDEVLCAGWNPALALQQHAYMERSQALAMPPELVAVDIDQFMRKMYAYQR